MNNRPLTFCSPCLSFRADYSRPGFAKQSRQRTVLSRCRWTLCQGVWLET
jgi:hypothetical protein